MFPSGQGLVVVVVVVLLALIGALAVLVGVGATIAWFGRMVERSQARRRPVPLVEVPDPYGIARELEAVRGLLARGKRFLGADFCAEDPKVRGLVLQVLRAEGWTVEEQHPGTDTGRQGETWSWGAKLSREYTDGDLRRALQRSPTPGR